MVIYKIENKINGKVYIGQTNDFKLRINGHKSNAFNPKSNSYNLPICCAIRKYGWDNFTKIIIETIEDDKGYEYVDKRERYYIEYYNSLCDNNGYNIELGGVGGPKREKLTYEEKLYMSNIFTPEEIKDIQNLLILGEEKIKIREKYYPRLGESYLDNINSGANFGNEEWDYPLHVYKHYSVKYTRQEMDEIRKEISEGKFYKDIHEKWNISQGLLSLINNGKIWYDDKYTYPLSYRSTSRLQNRNTWVKEVQEDLINSNMSLKDIANKYNKAYSTIKKINTGSSHRNSNYKYPLTKNRK